MKILFPQPILEPYNYAYSCVRLKKMWLTFSSHYGDEPPPRATACFVLPAIYHAKELLVAF